MSAEPDEIRWVPVGEVGEVRMGKQLSPASSQADGMHAPYLRVANVLDGRIDYSDVKTMSFSPSERQKYGLEPGDILLNEGQSLELVGRSAIYDGPPGEYCFQNTLIRFRSGAGVVPAYAREVFRTWLNDGTFAAIAKKTTSIAHLGGDRFAKLVFPLVPLARQWRIVEILDALTESERVEQQNATKLRAVEAGTISALLGRQRSLGTDLGREGYVTCGSVVKMAGGFPLGQAEVNPSGRYPIIGSSGQAGKGNRQFTGGPTIVIGRVGEGGVGSVRFVSEPAWVTDNALWVREFAPGWIPEFLSVYLDWCDLRKLRSQTGQPLITQGAINGVLIPRLDLVEQQRIVRVQQAWEGQRRVSCLHLNKLRTLRNGILEDLFSGKVRPAVAPTVAA
ncbi:restriction endonuclease subunit S [Streptomyces sp. NPDC051658]|uniref:restriction endonuclease subunit S n=1 Tax=Streptomyces sp. NPDC051658 TaxID=3365667 RepID=UPI0037B25069